MQVYRYDAQYNQQWTKPHHRQYIHPKVLLHHTQVNQIITSLEKNISVQIPNAGVKVKTWETRSEKKYVGDKLEVIVHHN